VSYQVINVDLKKQDVWGSHEAQVPRCYWSKNDRGELGSFESREPSSESMHVRQEGTSFICHLLSNS
jgi:hypothetical protein